MSLCGGLFFGLAHTAETLPDLDKSKFSVLVYDRVKGADQSGEISPLLIEDHIAEYSGSGYHVASLDELFEAIKEGRTLPPRSLALTFTRPNQTAYRSVFKSLKEKELSYTVFVNPREVSAQTRESITWGQLRELASDGVEVGLLLSNQSQILNPDSAQIEAKLDASIASFLSELGRAPKYVSYPARGLSEAMRTLVRSRNIVAAFDRQSGPVHGLSDFYNLPRFTMTDSFGTIERVRLSADTLPLPVEDVLPRSAIAISGNPPLLSFSIPERFQGVGRVSCYLSGLGKLPIEIIAGLRVEIRTNQQLKPGYHRVNCTAATRAGPWRWYSRRLYIAS